MNSVSTQHEPVDTVADRAGDALLSGLVVMLVLNLGQRAIGLARNLGFCHFLQESELGLWAMANSFFMIGAPIAVLGLPGSLGKFVEHYRLQGCLRPYLVRLVVASSVGVLAFCGLLVSFPNASSSVLYGSPTSGSVVLWTAVCLIFLVIFNTSAELVMALRLVRLSSLMHLINTSVFSTLGIVGIAVTGSWTSLLPAFAVACLAAILPGLWGVWRATGEELSSSTQLSAQRMWSRIVPFAVALWCSNLMSNLFDLSDRYMLLHLCPTGVEQGQALVGQFYCARILPNLLVSLGMMLAGILLPYFSADWERRLFDRISFSMNRMLILLGLGFTGLSLISLTIAPLLFNWLLEDRYSQAAEILPLGLLLACWSGLSTVAATYLLCAEKGKQNAVLLAASLLVNIVLNWPLIIWLGLWGAALATGISNGFLLALVLWRIHREGCHIRWRTIFFCGLPVSLCIGVPFTAASLMLLAVVCGRTNWLLTDLDRRSIDQAVVPFLNRFRLPIRTIWPSTPGIG